MNNAVIPESAHRSPPGGAGLLPWNPISTISGLLLMAAILCGLVVLGAWNYLLFHSLVELFSIGVAIAIFMIAWNVRRRMCNDFLLFVAIAYAAVCLLDLVHALAYDGMGAIPGLTVDEPTQLWIAARYLQALCLLIAPLWLTRRLPCFAALTVLFLIDILVLLSVFHPWAWVPRFPACHLGAQGLTAFKIVSEYVISGILLAALGFLWWRRNRLDREVFAYVAVALLVTVASELAFTSYVSVKAPSNMIGHLLKFVAVCLTYRALIVAGLQRPFDVLFRELAESERRFRTLTSATFEGIVESEGGRILDCNEQFARMLGYSVPELKGMQIGRLIADEDLDRVKERINQGDDSTIEHTAIRKDGTRICMEARGRPVSQGSRKRHTAVRDITERKRAEEQLRDLTQRLTYHVDNSPLAVIEWGPDMRLIRWAGTAEKVFGWKAEEVLGKRMEDFRWIYQEDREKVAEAVAELRTGANPRRFSLNRNYRKDGSVVQCEWYNSSLVDESGKLRSILSLVLDVTERKREEEALRRDVEKALHMSEQEFRSLAEAMPQIVWVTRPDGWNIYFNQQWVEYTGMTLKESYGHGWNTPFHPDDKQRAWEAWQRATQHNEIYSLECRLRRADGVYRWWLIRGVPVFGAKGEILKWFGTCTDIEELKLSEAALHEANDMLERRVTERTAELQESEMRLRTLADSMLNLAWWANGDGYITWYNRRWYEYTGTTQQQMEGWGWQSVHDPQMLPKVMERWKDSIAKGQQFEMEFPLRGADGKFRTFLTRVQPLKDAQGRVVQWFGTNTDVDDLKRIEDSLRQTLEDLQRSNRDLEQFAYVASHDLQEPLRTVSNFMGLLQERYKGKLDSNADEFIGFAVDGANRMSSLVHDLLAYSRAGRPERKSGPVRSGEALEKALRNLRGTIADHDVLVTHDELPTVTGDITQLSQLFQNLIGNAIKFHRQGVRSEIHVSARFMDEATPQGRLNHYRWLFSVRDNGIGIDPQFHEKIFMIFQRLHHREKYPGTGIGLAICKKIVEHHGGRIWVESEPGKGTTFFFTIPDAKGGSPNG